MGLAPIGLNFSLIRPITCEFGVGAGLKLIQADSLDPRAGQHVRRMKNNMCVSQNKKKKEIFTIE